MKWILLFICLCIFSCRSIQYVPVETVKTEKEYVDRIKRDSIYVRDSVFVLVKGDTVFSDKYHIVYRDRLMHDTVNISKTDSIAVPYSVEVVKNKVPGIMWWLVLLLFAFSIPSVFKIIRFIRGKI